MSVILLVSDPLGLDWFFYFEKIRVFKAGLRNEYISME